MVTIREVAEAAGVSTATVSRLLAGQNVQSAERIRQVIGQLGYRPNPSAASLRTGTHHTIGVISPDTSNSLLAEIVQGIQQEARSHGYRVVAGDSNEDAREERDLIDDLAQRTDGLLVFPVLEAAALDGRSNSLPLVLVDRDSFRDEPHDLVSVDNSAGARLAVEHLAGLGHTRIATIAGPLATYPGRLRYEGYVLGMRAAGLEISSQYVIDGGFKDRSGAAAMAALLELDEPPTAVFVANNAMTIGAYSHLRLAGVRIADEVSLVGFDDFRLAELLTPPVTVITRPTFEQGRRAGRLLFERIADRASGTLSDPKRITLDVGLTVRGSTGPAPLRKDQS